MYIYTYIYVYMYTCVHVYIWAKIWHSGRASLENCYFWSWEDGNLAIFCVIGTCFLNWLTGQTGAGIEGKGIECSSRVLPHCAGLLHHCVAAL